MNWNEILQLLKFDPKGFDDPVKCRTNKWRITMNRITNEM